MIYLIPFLLSFFIGYLIITLLRKETSFNDPLSVFLGMGLGIGVSSQIIFYVLVLCNGLNVFVVISVHFILLFFLFALRMFRRKRTIIPQASLNKITIVRFCILFSPFILLLIFNAFSRPYGDWDAWSLWNFRANFLFRAQEHWRELFYYGLQGNHPWLLPFSIVWGWSFIGYEHFMIPIMFSIILTISTVGILIYGLNQYIDSKKSILAGFFLLSIPFFIQYSTSQYADIVVTYYLLASIICLLRTMRTTLRSEAFLTGIFLGLLGFSKDHGILLAFLLLMLFLIYLINNRLFFRLGSFLFLGILVAMPSVVFVKILMSSNKHDLVYKFNLFNILILNRWSFILKYVLKDLLFNFYWGGIWTIFVVALLAYRKYFLREFIIPFVCMIIFLGLILLGYVISQFDVNWCLSTTWDRILFQVSPLAVFIMFHLFHAFDSAISIRKSE
ncbi:MAG: hypothetical protein HY209_06150 [Candidatus Omnitrophica bacterium]|nr:hypothetical protein [Candidatus Omnitrophota bacterium]